MASASQLRTLNRLRAEAPRRPCHWHRCRWDRWSGVVIGAL